MNKQQSRSRITTTIPPTMSISLFAETVLLLMVITSSSGINASPEPQLYQKNVLPRHQSKLQSTAAMNIFPITGDDTKEKVGATTITTTAVSDNNTLTAHRMLERRYLQEDICVTTEIELRHAIWNAVDFIPTRIDICVPILYIAASIADPIYQGINIQNKNLDIRCRDSSTTHCIIDAQGLSRHFYAISSTLSFRSIRFFNGNGRKDEVNKRVGGSLWLQQSKVTFEQCQFINNYGSEGGAFYMSYSAVTILTGPTIDDATLFENNKAFSYGGAIAGISSSITATVGSFIFRNNYGGLNVRQSLRNIERLDLLRNIHPCI
jgi:predicted outer membrane repeat protein